MKKVISNDHDVIRVPVSLLSNENFLKLTSRPIDLLFALAHRKNTHRSVQELADLLDMRVVNLYRERRRLKEAGFLQFNDGKVHVSFPLDSEITGYFYLPYFLVQERLSTEEWRLMLTLYRTAHEQRSATFKVRTSDLCAFSGINEKNVARIRRELISKVRVRRGLAGKGLIWYSNKEYSLIHPVTQEGVDKVFELEV